MLLSHEFCTMFALMPYSYQFNKFIEIQNTYHNLSVIAKKLYAFYEIKDISMKFNLIKIQ